MGNFNRRIGISPVEVSYINNVAASSVERGVAVFFLPPARSRTQIMHYATSDDQLGGAIAVKCTLRPGERGPIPIVLFMGPARDPVRSGPEMAAAVYTDFFGTSGTHAWDIAAAGLREDQNWSARLMTGRPNMSIDNSKRVVSAGHVVFNEMTSLLTSGTVWRVS